MSVTEELHSVSIGKKHSSSPMEHTFITIHNLSPEANILFASESITDILGYRPDEVQGKSCFDYFHPDEVPFARSVHSRGVLLDKAAVLHYARIVSRNGQWVSCECCFTIVHDVLVASTSIYRRGARSERRAMEAPQIRRIFSCSPRDPRYHMLEHLSPKFKMPPMEREPRAALILNRFTRNLTVMFATNAVTSILGLRPDQIKDLSFYRCIQENCLPEALRCLESAKANDSIAYLRFWFRDPRSEEDLMDAEMDQHEDGHLSCSTSDSEGGGAQLDNEMDLDSEDDQGPEIKVEREADSATQGLLETFSPQSNAGGGKPTPLSDDESTAVPSTFDGDSDQLANNNGALVNGGGVTANRRSRLLPSIELEAVVSCTSDGLVVILRKARPPIPAPHPPLVSWEFQNGLFAAPWGQQPIRPFVPPELLYTFRPPLLPQFMPLRDNVKAAGGPPLEQLMRSIRDVAVFAWALVGINGNLASHSHGLPAGESQPPDGLPIWDPNTGARSYLGPENQASQRWEELERARMVASEASYGNSYLQDIRNYSQQQMLNGAEHYTYAQPQNWPQPHVTHTTVYEPVPHPHMGSVPAFHRQHFQQHHYQNPPPSQQSQRQSDMIFHGLPQEMSSSSASSPVFPTPTQSSSSDQGQGYRSLWR